MQWENLPSPGGGGLCISFSVNAVSLVKVGLNDGTGRRLLQVTAVDPEKDRGMDRGGYTGDSSGLSLKNRSPGT